MTSPKKHLNDVKEPIAIAKQLFKGGARCYYGFNSFNEVEDFVSRNKKASLHEVTRCGVRGLQRLFLDIDAKYTDFPDITKEQINSAYNVLLQSVFEILYFNIVAPTGATSTQTALNDDAFFLDGSREDKFSMHVVYKNIYIDGEHYSCICKDIIDNFTRNLEFEQLPVSLVKIIDVGVYGRNHCVRIHTSRKFGTDHRLILKDDHTAAFNKETLVTYKPHLLNGAQYYKCSDGCTGLEQIKHQSNITDEGLLQIEQVLDGLKEFGITVAKMDKQYPRLNIDHSLPCYVCGGKHDSENLMCVIGPDVKLICRRQPVGSKKRFKTILTRNNPIDVCKPINDFADVITVADRVPNIINTVGVNWTDLAIKAVMGAGKTRQIAEFIATNPNITCVFPTYRRGLAAKLATNISLFLPAGSKPFESYEDISSGDIDITVHRKVTIQYESLHRLVLTNEKIDLIVIDEATSFAQHTLSRLNEDKNGLNQMMLRNLLENSVQNVFMDALLDEPTLDAYRQYVKGRRIHVWVVKPKTLWGANIKIHKDATRWRDNLLEDIRNGKRIYISTTNGESWIKQIRNIILTAKPTIRVLMIYSGLATNKQVIQNINEEFIKYDIVIASPCISSGVSFDVEGHFDKIYTYVDNSGPNAVDVIQSLRRVRNSIAKEVVVCDATYKYWLPTTFEDIKRSEQIKLRFNRNDFIHDGIELVMNGPNYEFANNCSPFLLFRLYCMRIHNLNSMDIFGTLTAHLIENGCTITEEVGKFEAGTASATYAKTEKKEFKDGKKKEKCKNYEDVAKATVLTADEYDDLCGKLKSGRSTYKRINNDANENLSIMRKFLNDGNENAQMRKYNLLKYYGLYNNKDRWKLFNSAENVEKYSNKRVMKFYKEMAYRDLPIEFVEKIDAEGTVNMNDDEKQTYRYLAGKHTIINKIREIFKDGFVEYPTILEYVKSLHKIKIPQFARFKEPTNKSVIAMVDKLIRPYGLKADSKRVGNGTQRRRVMFIKDISSELFEIKVLPYNSNNDVRNNTLQSGQTDKPVVIVYSC